MAGRRLRHGSSRRRAHWCRPRRLAPGLALLLQLAAPSAATAQTEGRATYRLLSTRYDMELDPESLVWRGRSKEVRRFRVDGSKGLDLGTFSVARSSILEIDAVRVRVRRRGEKDWKDAELMETEHSPWKGYSEFTDYIIREHTIRGLAIGDEVEIQIEQRHRVAWEIPDYRFGDRDSIEQEIYEVRIPQAVVPAHDVHPGLLPWPAPRFTESHDKGRRVLRWEEAGQPGLGAREPDAPPLERLLPTVRVAPALLVTSRGDSIPLRRSWSDFAKWYEGRVRPQMDLPPDLRAWAASERAAARDRDDLVARVFAHVQERVRYLAIEIGEGGWVPRPAAATYQSGYGDCKDMSTLLVALLRETGVPAHLSLVRARGSGPVNAAFPYCLQFDHCVAWVPDARGDWWLDATGGFLEAGETTPFITENPALVIAADSTRLLRPRARGQGDDSITERFEVGPEAEGRATLEFELRVAGSLAPDWRHSLRHSEPKERLELVRIWLGRSFDNVSNVEMEDPRSSPGEVLLRGRCGVRSPLQATAGGGILRRGIAKVPLPRVLASRRLPLDLGPSLRLRTFASIRLPRSAPPDSSETRFEASFAGFHVRAAARGDRWTCERQLDWKAEIVAAEDLPRLAEFTRKVQRENDAMLSIAER